ncbi:sulfite exporter TauE/SafE family protein [Glaciecola sp. MF2-115]|uniref:sulfite exporter TauE/SafE family protein n=1 Tax=Glaciecola sp. MF2-115 TaxID=3384827 RepID=UPI0039A1C2DC
MDPNIVIFLLCAVLGSAVGVMAGLLGIGGGLLIVPAMVFLLHYYLGIDIDIGMPIAIATSLSTVIMTGLSSTRSHYKMGNLDKRIVLYCGLGIAVGAILGAQFASFISGAILQRIFALLVILIALQMIFGSHKMSKNTIGKPGLGGIGVGTGFVSALMGIGGGALLVPALLWYQINIRKAIGCAAFSGVIVALFGTLTFMITGFNKPELPAYSIGYVYLPATFGIIATSVLTAPIGVKLGQGLDTIKLKKVFATFLVLVSIRMIIGIE